MLYYGEFLFLVARGAGIHAARLPSLGLLSPPQASQALAASLGYKNRDREGETWKMDDASSSSSSSSSSPLPPQRQGEKEKLITFRQKKRE